MTIKLPQDDSEAMYSASRLFFQLLRISFGFVLAVLVLGVFIAWGFFGHGGDASDPYAIVATFSTGAIAASAIGGVVFFPALVAIAVAEVLRLRGIMFHVGVAGAIALGIWIFGSSEPMASGLRPGSSVVLAGGFLAGFTYWLVAGRLSGCWMSATVANSESGG